MNASPFFSIITVARNDAWSLIKTARSVFEQNSRDFEYIIVDGASDDHSQRLVEFWQTAGLVKAAISEPDKSVYEAMNKGLRMARGEFVCFLNASDVFADQNVLQHVQSLLGAQDLDGVLGWGEVNDQIWSSWTKHEAFKMASLGFCHQALFVRRALLERAPFDERPFKTDSDTRQLGRLFAQGAKIDIVPEILAVRGGEPGISANLERSGRSIRNTLTEEYPELDDVRADQLINFRRRCENVDVVLALLNEEQPLSGHVARMVLDTLFLRQSVNVDTAILDQLLSRALDIVLQDDHGDQEIEQLVFAQKQRVQILEQRKDARRNFDKGISIFEAEEERRIAHLKPIIAASNSRTSQFVVSLTSFPARLKTVHLVINSLFEQTCPPREIHLWLGRDEVPNKNWLPKRLRALEDRGAHFHFAERTFHQYDKFLHNSELNANTPFVIVDDDAIYPPTSLERLLDGHSKYPEAIIGNRCHNMIGLREDGTFHPYRNWRREAQMPEPSLLLLPTGVGGVLYPPGFLSDSMVTSIGDILAYAPYADDLWLKACALARGVPTFATSLSHKADWYHRYTPSMRIGTLMETNVERGLNDVQLARCLDWLDQVKPAWREGLSAVELAA